MGNDFDAFVNQLQDQIFEETRSAYGQVAYERWRSPRYVGKLDEADGAAAVKGSCGDTIEIYLKFKGDAVSRASFTTDGCGSSLVCGSFAAETAIGKRPEEILDVTGETILHILGGLPDEDRHCAFLAVDALHQAVDDYMRRQTARNRERIR